MSLQDKIRQLSETAEKAAKEAVAKVGEVTHESRESISTQIDKVASTIDAKTDGKYADKVAKAKEQVTKGVDKLADQRRDGDATPGSPTAEQADPNRTNQLEQPHHGDPTAYEPPHP